MSLVTLRDINLGFGHPSLMENINLRIEEGEIEEGSIEFLGERIDRKSPEKIVRMGICAVSEGVRSKATRITGDPRSASVLSSTPARTRRTR